MDRRRFLRRAGVATVLTSSALAGCSDDGGSDGGDGGSDGGDGGSDGGDGGSDGGDGGSDGGDGGSDGGTATPTPGGPMNMGSTAPYDTWATPAVFSSEQIQAFSVETSALQDSSAGPTPTPTPGGTQGPIDPILGLPLVFSIGAAFSGFALSGFGLGQITSENGPAERIHTVGNALVFEGSYDPDSIASTVSESQASESGTYGGFTEFTSGSGDSASVLAVSGDSLITTGSEATEPTAVVEAAIDAAAGDAPAYSADHAAYGELASVLDPQPITGVAFSPSGPINAGTPTPTPTPSMGGGNDDLLNIGDFQPEGDILGYAAGLSISEDQEEATAQMAHRYTGPGEVGDIDTLVSQIAPNAADVSTTTGGSMVRFTAQYSDFSSF